MTKTQKVIVFSSLLISIIFTCWYFYVDLHYFFYKRHVIFWNRNTEIKVQDFQSISNLDSDSNIFFYHEIYLKAKNRNDVKAFAIFDKSKSWIKDTSNFNNKIKSQKLIFDLYESFARKLNKRIESVKDNENIDFKDLIKIGDENYDELQVYVDSIYDSDLSRDEIIKIWRPKIDSLLIKYK